MSKIDIEVPDGVSGEWSVTSFVVEERELSQIISMFKTGRGVPAGNYKRLMRNGVVVMSNTPDEIRDFWHFVCKAKGHVLVNGLVYYHGVVSVNSTYENNLVRDCEITYKDGSIVKIRAIKFEKQK